MPNTVLRVSQVLVVLILRVTSMEFVLLFDPEPFSKWYRLASITLY